MPRLHKDGPAPVPDHCSSCPVRTLTPYGGIHEDEAKRLFAMRTRNAVVPANTDIICLGDEPTEVVTLFSGWAYRYMRFSDGARQILSIVLPGEPIGLSTLPGGNMSHSVRTITACSFCCLDKAAMRKYLTDDHQACQSVFRYTIRRRDRTERQAALLGRRQARQRVAAVLADLHGRLRQLGLADTSEFPFPLRHTHVADLVGLTSIHVSRVFRDLESDRIIRRLNRRIRVLDPKRLMVLADSDADTHSAVV